MKKDIITPLLCIAMLAIVVLIFQYQGCGDTDLAPVKPPAPAPGPVDPPAPVPPSPSPLPDDFGFGKVNHCTAEQLQKLEVLQVPVLVKFGADWCGPCQSLKPNLEKFADAAGEDVLVVSLELTEDKGPFDRFKIRSMPTMVVMYAGKELKRIVGVLSPRSIAAFVDDAIHVDKT